MNRDIGNLIGCLLLALLALITLPVILLLLVFQILTGRRVVYMNRFRPKGNPSGPERDPEPQPSRPMRASEEIIDVEVVDLPDSPASEPPRLEKRDRG